MFQAKFNGESWDVWFEEKMLVSDLSESQAMDLWKNLDELLEEFITLEDSELEDEEELVNQ